jgi:hypothetical protein
VSHAPKSPVHEIAISRLWKQAAIPTSPIRRSRGRSRIRSSAASILLRLRLLLLLLAQRTASLPLPPLPLIRPPPSYNDEKCQRRGERHDSQTLQEPIGNVLVEKVVGGTGHRVPAPAAPVINVVPVLGLGERGVAVGGGVGFEEVG